MTYVARSLYVGALVLLVVTAWLVISGTQLIRDTGDFARFGAMLFQLLAPFQLVLLLFFAATTAAASVAQEKDRKTLVLLLMTRMSNSELVLGKLTASMVQVLSMLAASLPILMLIVLLGGVSYIQVVRVLLVTLAAAVGCGSLGSLVALARDKTFQAISTTLLVIVGWIGFWEVVGAGIFGASWFGIATSKLAVTCSPWSAVITASRPAVETDVLGPIAPFLVLWTFLTVMQNVVAIVMVRVWNPSREARSDANVIEQDTWIRASRATGNTLADAIVIDSVSQHEEKQAAMATDVNDVNNVDEVRAVHGVRAGRIRHAWDNPILWREVCTRAYGKRVWIVQAAFIAFFAVSAWILAATIEDRISVSPAELAGTILPLCLLSLILVNAQSITSLTSERDGGTFDLLLVSDLTPQEFVYGKLGGIAWNMKWVILLPLLLCGFLWWRDVLSPTHTAMLLGGLVTLYLFVAMVGLHIGMNYTATRQATAMSLGVIFFLFVGVACCIWIMVAFNGSFETQLQPFLAFMVGGGIGLYVTLGARNPSSAIALASFILPIATFYAITSLLLGYWHLVFVAIVGAYGFTTLAMFVPAIAEFDVATGRTTAD
ncbi:MAG: ABC transporter permease subunit [Thermoguttaceae bacterium]